MKTLMTLLIDILCNTSDVLFVVVNVIIYEGKKKHSSKPIYIAQGKLSCSGRSSRCQLSDYTYVLYASISKGQARFQSNIICMKLL